MHFWNMLDSIALLSMALYTLTLAVFCLNYNLHVAFYVAFCNFHKKNTKNQSVKIQTPIMQRRPFIILFNRNRI